MGNETISAVIVMVLLFTGICAGGLLVYHFLVFDNIQGFVGDLTFYEQDGESPHYLYWFFFWNIILFSGILARTSVKTN